MSLNKSSSTRRASRSQQEQRRLSHPERLSQPSADSFDATLWNLNLASSASRSAQPPNSTTPLTTPGTSLSAITSITHLTSIEEPVVGGTNTTSTTSQPSITIQYTLSSTSLLNTTVANPAGRILYIIDTKPRNRYDKILTCGWSKTSRTTISRVALAGVTEEIASVEWKVVRRDVVKFFGKREMDVDEFLPREPRSRRRFLDTTEGRWTWTNGKDGQFELLDSSGTVVARWIKARRKRLLSRSSRPIYSSLSNDSEGEDIEGVEGAGDPQQQHGATLGLEPNGGVGEIQRRRNSQRQQQRQRHSLTLTPSPASLLISPEGVRILDVIIIGFMVMQRDESGFIPRPRWRGKSGKSSNKKGVGGGGGDRGDRASDQFTGEPSTSEHSRIVAIEV